VPALLSWGASWAAFRLLLLRGWPMGGALAIAALIGVLLSLWGNSWWRKAVIAAGFPVSFALSLPMLGLGDMPAWVWLLPLVLMLLVYPVNTWADAPLFPTPAKALRALPTHAPLLAGARVLDAGCGLGHGLRALRQAYPQAQFYGLEWSATLRWLCALRLPWARITRGDIWLADWSGYDMVYLFQRPESMPRAVAKATKELRTGAFMVSLDFEAAQLVPLASYKASDGKMVWIYQAPFHFVGP
jgi:SAM-dependent methyltransferase